MAAKLRPCMILPRFVPASDAHVTESRGRQLQRLVGRRLVTDPSTSRYSPLRVQHVHADVGKARFQIYNDREAL